MHQLNQRLDRLPLLPAHRWVIGIFVFAYFFELADLSTFAYAAPQIIKLWGITLHSVALITSASFCGMFFGSLAGGGLADRFGRKPLFVASVLFYTLSSLLNAFAWNIASLAAFRLMTGVGLSAMTVVASAYTMEYFPAVSRGKILSMIVAISLVGIPATAWVARAVVPVGEHGWRFIFVWGALGILVVPASIRKLSESPRWLFLHGEQERANGIVEQLEAVALQRHGSLAPLKSGSVPVETAKVSYRQLLNSQYRSRFIVVTLMSICSALGFYGFIAWVPTLLVQHGFSVVKSLSYSSMMALCNPLGALLAMTVIERIERKYFIVMASICIAVVVTFYGWTANPVFIVIFGALAVMCLQCSTVGVWTYQSEVFPTEVRSGATGFVYGVGRMANIVGPFIVSGLYGAFGYYSVFFYIAVCYLAGGAIAAIFGPKTTGRALEDIGDSYATSGDEALRSGDVGSVNTRGLS